MTRLHLDWESKSEIDLTQQGLDVYSAHPSTKVIMGAWAINDGRVKHWDANDGSIPAELKEALLDPHVERWAFNGQFERVMARRVLGIKTPYEGWRCTKVLAHTQSFVGQLGQIVKQMGLPQDVEKDADGKRLIKKFCMPQRTTKAQPLRWRDRWTDEEDWERFCQYNVQDVVAERDGLYHELIKYPPPDIEWQLYEIDQRTNDRGLPINRRFVENASAMSKLRQAELTQELVDVTDLANPNSPKQLLEWVQSRGYPFDDLRKDTVKKVLAENAEQAQLQLEVMVEAGEEGDDADIFYDPQTFEGGFLSGEAVQALRLRQQAARTSVKKYDKILKLMGPGDRLRFGLQFHGASRTGRDAGRGLNPQNLSRPPAELDVSKDALKAGVDEDAILVMVTKIVESGDYEALKLAVSEPMNALAGIVRSSIGLPDDADEELCAADLSSIETVVIGWTSGCKRLLDVFRNKKDAYKDFGSMMYKMAYEDIVGKLRQNSKPAVLGCGFRLGGGELIDGKRTGLWGYAEAMGINMTREESHKAVHTFRKEAYPEVPYLWYGAGRRDSQVHDREAPCQPCRSLPGRQVRRACGAGAVGTVPDDPAPIRPTLVLPQAAVGEAHYAAAPDARAPGRLDHDEDKPLVHGQAAERPGVGAHLHPRRQGHREYRSGHRPRNPHGRSATRLQRRVQDRAARSRRTARHREEGRQLSHGRTADRAVDAQGRRRLA